MRKWEKRHRICAYIMAAALCLTVVWLLSAKFKCSRDADSNEASVLYLARMRLLKKIIAEKHIWIASVFGTVLHNI